MPLPKELEKAAKQITTLRSRHTDMLNSLMMREVRMQMQVFARKLKPTTSLKLDEGMGVVNFVIIRPTLPDIWLSDTDIWYNYDTGAHPAHLTLNPWYLRDRVLYPLIQCLEFISLMAGDAHLYPDSLTVKGTKASCAR